MRRVALGALALACLAIGMTASLAAVPTKVPFSARLVDEESGEAVTGPHRIAFALYDRETGGQEVWQEGFQVEVDDGVLFTELGATTALDSSVFDGKPLWLEVKLDDVTMEPRIAIGSVPYAIHAATADKVGDVADPQQRVTGTCSQGNFIIAVNADGTVTCAPDLSGTGDVTSVLAGTGLQGGGMSGDLTLSLLQTCAAGQILKWSGSAWQCAADAGASGGNGDITSVTVGPAGGLTGGGASGDVQLSLLNTCATNQVLKWNGGTWGCANDNDTDTNSGGDITSVTTAVGTGLQGGAAMGDAALSLLTSCGMNQILKWNGSAWACANDVDTDTNSGGDISDVIAGAGLTGGGAAGAVTVDVTAGQGISVSANAVALDTAFTDGRYLNTAGDILAGALDAGGFRITNRGCPSGYVRMQSLCVESVDATPFTFTGCANRCRAANAHMCSSAELRSAIASGIAVTNPYTLDWVDDQDADDSAIYINDGTTVENPDGTRATSTASWCRCCTDVE